MAKTTTLVQRPVVDAIAGLPGFVVALDIGAMRTRICCMRMWMTMELRLVATVAGNELLDSSITPLIYSGFQEALAKIIKQNADYGGQIK